MWNPSTDVFLPSNFDGNFYESVYIKVSVWSLCLKIFCHLSFSGSSSVDNAKFTCNNISKWLWSLGKVVFFVLISYDAVGQLVSLFVACPTLKVRKRTGLPIPYKKKRDHFHMLSLVAIISSGHTHCNTCNLLRGWDY